MDIDFRKLKLSNGKTIEQQLKIEAKRFVAILQKHIDDWYSSYTPTVYQRTYAMQECIDADDVVSIDTSKGTLQIHVKYTDMAYHNAMYGNEQVNTLFLLDKGYSVNRDVWFKNVPYFGFRSGGGFLEDAVDEFNASNYFGVVVDVIYPDTIYR